MLLALLTSERGQTLHLLIAVDDVVVEKDYVEIRYSSLLKKKNIPLDLIHCILSYD